MKRSFSHGVQKYKTSYKEGCFIFRRTQPGIRMTSRVFKPSILVLAMVLIPEVTSQYQKHSGYGSGTKQRRYFSDEDFLKLTGQTSGGEPQPAPPSHQPRSTTQSPTYRETDATTPFKDNSPPPWDPHRFLLPYPPTRKPTHPPVTFPPTTERPKKFQPFEPTTNRRSKPTPAPSTSVTRRRSRSFSKPEVTPKPGVTHETRSFHSRYEPFPRESHPAPKHETKTRSSPSPSSQDNSVARDLQAYMDRYRFPAMRHIRPDYGRESDKRPPAPYGRESDKRPHAPGVDPHQSDRSDYPDPYMSLYRFRMRGYPNPIASRHPPRNKPNPDVDRHEFPNSHPPPRDDSSKNPSPPEKKEEERRSNSFLRNYVKPRRSYASSSRTYQKSFSKNSGTEDKQGGGRREGRGRSRQSFRRGFDSPGSRGSGKDSGSKATSPGVYRGLDRFLNSRSAFSPTQSRFAPTRDLSFFRTP